MGYGLNVIDHMGVRCGASDVVLRSNPAVLSGLIVVQTSHLCGTESLAPLKLTRTLVVRV